MWRSLMMLHCTLHSPNSCQKSLKYNANFPENHDQSFSPIFRVSFDFGDGLLLTHVVQSLNLMWQISPNSSPGSIICYNVFRMMNLDVKYGSVKEYYRKVVQEKQGNHGDFLAAVQVWIEKHNSNPTMARLRDTDAIKTPVRKILTEDRVGNRLVAPKNVDAIEDSKPSGGSNLEVLKSQLSALGYEGQIVKTDALEFGLPCHRRRVFAFFVRVVASPLFVFQDRPFDKVFATFRGLLAGCLISLPRFCRCSPRQ